MKKELSSNEKSLIQAVSDCSLDSVVNIITNGDVDVNCVDEHGMSPLQHACYKGDLPIAKYLIENGADVNQNEHEHGYTSLMFAALGGHTAVLSLLLEHDANVNAVNAVGRNASQMAGFVGQFLSVAAINNFLKRDYIEYYSKVTGLEKEPRLPVRLIQPVHTFVRIINIHPIRIAFYLKNNSYLIEDPNRISNVLEHLGERLIRSSDPNETFSLKVHCLKFIFDFICKAIQQIKKKKNGESLSKSEIDSVINSLIKTWITVNDKGFCESVDRLLRESVRSYPYHENALFQQLVRTMATVEVGDEPNAFTILCQAIIGKSMSMDESNHCFTCWEFNPDKRCSKCKVATYCDQICQKMHWPVHKTMCNQMLKQKLKHQQMLDQEKEKFEKQKSEKTAEDQVSKVVDVDDDCKTTESSVEKS